MPNLGKLPQSDVPAKAPELPTKPAPQAASEPKTGPVTAGLPQKTAQDEHLDPHPAGHADPALSLGFDDSKPTVAPDLGGRFRKFGRFIDFPAFSLDEKGTPKLVNPLPASGLALSDHERGGLVLEGTPRSPAGIFASIDAPSQAVASLYDALAHRYPTLEANLLWRLAKVGTYVAIDVPLMVAAHEMGHGAAAVQSSPNSAPTVTMTHWMSGYTSYNLPEGQSFTEREKLFTSVAGMNQATYNGEVINQRMHTQGADLKDAIGYLVNITNSMNYQLKDWIKQAKPGYNDGASYHELLESRMKGWNQENLSMLAVGVNLLNADFWASLIGAGKYIATGDEVRLPELRFGQAGLSFPHFSLMHTFEGPQLNTSIYGHLSGPETLELKYSQLLTPDLGPGFGLEARLHGLAVPGSDRQLTIGPRVGISVHERELGFKTGLEAEFRPGNNPYISLTTGLDYRHNYLPDQSLPHGSGFQATGGARISFW